MTLSKQPRQCKSAYRDNSQPEFQCPSQGLDLNPIEHLFRDLAAKKNGCPRMVTNQPDRAWEDLHRKTEENLQIQEYKACCIIPKKTRGCVMVWVNGLNTYVRVIFLFSFCLQCNKMWKKGSEHFLNALCMLVYSWQSFSENQLQGKLTKYIDDLAHKDEFVTNKMNAMHLEIYPIAILMFQIVH